MEAGMGGRVRSLTTCYLPCRRLKMTIPQRLNMYNNNYIPTLSIIPIYNNINIQYYNNVHIKDYGTLLSH